MTKTDPPAEMASRQTLGYPPVVETKRGRIDKGVVVLDDPADVPDGTEVTVIIGNADRKVDASDQELRVIDAGLAEARNSKRIDARAFLRELRLGR